MSAKPGDILSSGLSETRVMGMLAAVSLKMALPFESWVDIIRVTAGKGDGLRGYEEAMVECL